MLRIELTDWEDRNYHAEYDSFRIDDEKGLYRLHIGNYNGDAGDSLRSHWENHDGMPFRSVSVVVVEVAKGGGDWGYMEGQGGGCGGVEGGGEKRERERERERGREGGGREEMRVCIYL